MNPRPPLAVDLDGTLVRCDTLYQSAVALVRRSPLGMVRVLGRLRKGPAAVKQAVADAVKLDVSLLPYNQALLDYVRAERGSGRRVGLFTAADQSIADAVAAHLGCFDVVRGSDGATNLRGLTKAAAIEAAFGPVFAYAGDSAADVPVFDRATAVILAGAAIRRLAASVAAAKIEAVFPAPATDPLAWACALRMLR